MSKNVDIVKYMQNMCLPAKLNLVFMMLTFAFQLCFLLPGLQMDATGTIFVVLTLLCIASHTWFIDILCVEGYWRLSWFVLFAPLLYYLLKWALVLTGAIGENSYILQILEDMMDIEIYYRIFVDMATFVFKKM